MSGGELVVLEPVMTGRLLFTITLVVRSLDKPIENSRHHAEGIHGGDFSMLVLSRQRDETIVIGDSIRITIVEVRGDKVRIGIDAPKDVSVHRQEIYDAIKREMDGADTKDN